MSMAAITNIGCPWPTSNLPHRLWPSITAPHAFPAMRTRRSRRILVFSSNPKCDDESTRPDDPSSLQEDDLRYLLKLGAGSVAGAAAIKYGSILFPEITRPNIVQALFMISTPVVVAMLLLIKQSQAE